MKNADVIIVGAGPAGAVAGYILAKAGLKTLILDTKLFPRQKICGGGLTLKAYNELPFDATPVIHQSVSTGHIGFRGHLISSISINKPIAYLVDRLTFDNFLLEKAVDVGAQFIPGQQVKGFVDHKNQIKILTENNEYFCTYLVGADGVHSKIAKQTGLIINRTTSLAYEAHLSSQEQSPSESNKSITFDFGTILCGYGWIFPKKDHLNVGVCRTWPGKKASRKHLLRFIDQHPDLDHTKIIDIHAFPVPSGNANTTLHKGNILLVGDAANLADPWLGEGLYYALYSGKLAAKIIARHSIGELGDLSEYTKIINAMCTEQFPFAKRFSLLVNALPYLNVLLLKSSRTLQKMMIDVLTGDRSYHQVWQSLKSQIPGLVWGKIFGKSICK